MNSFNWLPQLQKNGRCYTGEDSLGNTMNILLHQLTRICKNWTFHCDNIFCNHHHFPHAWRWHSGTQIPFFLLSSVSQMYLPSILFYTPVFHVILLCTVIWYIHLQLNVSSSLPLPQFPTFFERRETTIVLSTVFQWILWIMKIPVFISHDV